MDSTHDGNSAFGRLSFSRRSRTVSESFGPLLQSFRKLRISGATARPIAGLLLVLLASLCALRAREASSQQALTDWTRTHRPSLTVLLKAASALSWKRITDMRTIEPLLRLVPISLEQPNSLWYQNSGQLILVLNCDQGTPCLFASPSTPPTVPREGRWQDLGEGWPAFETAVGIMEKNSQISAKSAVTKKQKRDPRELLF